MIDKLRVPWRIKKLTASDLTLHFIEEREKVAELRIENGKMFVDELKASGGETAEEAGSIFNEFKAKAIGNEVQLLKNSRIVSQLKIDDLSDANALAWLNPYTLLVTWIVDSKLTMCPLQCLHQAPSTNVKRSIFFF